MNLPSLARAAAAAALLLAACPGTEPVDDGTCTPACPSGKICVKGTCVTKAGGEDAGDIVIDPTPDAGAPVRPPADPFDPKNATKDTDCDGLSDQDEFSTVYPGQKKTDPNDADSDDDGISDGAEMGRASSPDSACAGFKADADPAKTSSPVNPDSDGDGVADGDEDKDHDGKLDPGESDPTNPDTDNDGIKDGVELKAGTNPNDRDTDHDGVPDGVEDANHDGTVAATETDPKKADTDGDGCLDGQEDKNWNHRLDTGETDPLKAGDCGPALGKDTDCDGLSDAEEAKRATDPAKADTDGDGLADGLESGVVSNPDPATCKTFKADADPSSRTDPTRVDSDCDGLKDGAEDKDGNGKVDSGETDPNKRDSDGDGLTDGVEAGACANLDATRCPNYVPDGNCGATKTDPANPDSDGDGIADGAEDSNQNGKMDPGELNPLDGTDGAGPAKLACATANMKKVTLVESSAADLAVAVTSDYTEVARPVVSGAEKAVMVYSPTQQVVGLAMLLTPTGASASDDETAGVTKLGGLGVVTNHVAQTFTTWDKHPASHGALDLSGGQDLKTIGNLIAQAFLTAPSGLFSGNAGVAGPFKVDMEYARRSGQRTVAVIAVMPASKWVARKPFVLSDLGGGSALAQFGDAHAAQCEVFNTAASAKVDFLWVVDNSGSMAASQNSVANAGQAMIDQLQNSTLDWRVAATTSSYYSTTTGASRFRPFTTDVNTIKSWFQQNGSDWFGISGSGYEQLLQSAKLVIQNQLLPKTAGNLNKLRPDATLVIILLGDSEDQSSGTAADFTTFFSNYDGQGSKAQVHAIECPLNEQCSVEESRITSGKIVTVIKNLGGVFGDVRLDRNGGTYTTTITAILDAAMAGVSPYSTQKPPIAPTLKVAMDPTALAAGSTCNAADVPRDRQDGFDFDGLTQRILFYGACRPMVSGKQVAVSYRYWIDYTANPNGNPDPCGVCNPPFVCDRDQGKCVCPSDCGAPTPGSAYYCDFNACKWTCAPDCNGCGTNWVCNTTNPAACKCECNPNITCGLGFRFDTTTCGCVCNPPSLGCGAMFNADAKLCACVCKPDCGGSCTGTLACDQSACECKQPPQ